MKLSFWRITVPLHIAQITKFMFELMSILFERNFISLIYRKQSILWHLKPANYIATTLHLHYAMRYGQQQKTEHLNVDNTFQFNSIEYKNYDLIINIFH